LQRELNQIEKENDMREIAVRGFINEKFNTTFGKGLFRRAVFNGSVELRNPNTKYLVDFYRYVEWENLAKTDDQMAIVRKLGKSDISQDDEVLMSWVIHYDPLTKKKTPIDGFAILSPSSSELYIAVNDQANGINEEWTLNTQSCKTMGVNKPVFIATNVDLGTWV
jgi:hypothetical protein